MHGLEISSSLGALIPSELLSCPLRELLVSVPLSEARRSIRVSAVANAPREASAVEASLRVGNIVQVAISIRVVRIGVCVASVCIRVVFIVIGRLSVLVSFVAGCVALPVLPGIVVGRDASGCLHPLSRVKIFLVVRGTLWHALLKSSTCVAQASLIMWCNTRCRQVAATRSMMSLLLGPLLVTCAV
jgi:hypothetical protein